MDRPAAHTHDVVVVGARCAGAATAMLLARQGLDVVVVDRADLPSDTLSTHSISRGGVVLLSRWGLLDDVLSSGAPPIRTASFHFLDGVTLTRDLKDRAGVDLLVAPRRHILDSILLRAAEDAGATVRTGVSVTGTVSDGRGRVTGVTLRDRDNRTTSLGARLVVGADGVRSRIARAVGARTIESQPSDASVAYAYVAGLDSSATGMKGDTPGIEMFIGRRSFAGIFPTHGGEANVWICLPGDTARIGASARADGFISLLARHAPALAARVRAARITSPVRRAAGLPNHVLEAAGPGWALVGDAGYHRDPITGHGITDAFRDAELLGRRAGQALRGELPEHVALARYAEERDEALAPIFEVSWRLAQYPPVDEFVALQKRLAQLIDIEATQLAELPALPDAIAA